MRYCRCTVILWFPALSKCPVCRNPSFRKIWCLQKTEYLRCRSLRIPYLIWLLAHIPINNFIVNSSQVTNMLCFTICFIDHSMCLRDYFISKTICFKFRNSYNINESSEILKIWACVPFVKYWWLFKNSKLLLLFAILKNCWKEDPSRNVIN